MKKSKNINTAFSDKNLWKERLRKHVTEDSASGGRKEAISEAEDDWRLSGYYFQIYLKRYGFLNISIEETFFERMNTLAHQLPSMGGRGAAMLKYFLLAYSGKVEKLACLQLCIHPLVTPSLQLIWPLMALVKPSGSQGKIKSHEPFDGRVSSGEKRCGGGMIGMGGI